MYTLLINTIDNSNFTLYKNNKVVLQQPFLLNEKVGDNAAYYLSLLSQQMLVHNLHFTDISKIAVFIGPGFFTAVRVGVIIANTLAYALNITNIVAIDNISFWHYFAQNNYNKTNKYSYTVVAINIGKPGAVVSIFSGDNVVLKPVYIEANEIEQQLQKYCVSTILAIGSRLELLYKLNNCATINHNAFVESEFIGSYITGINNNVKLPIEPNYVKEADVLVDNKIK